MTEQVPPALERAWRLLEGVLPREMYLGGGTAAALRLGHRESNDLDFFFHGNAVDLSALERELTSAGGVVVFRDQGTLRMQLHGAKVEFLHADEARPQRQLEPATSIGAIPVAGLKDLMAMKLKVLAERGEMRDYYDVRAIDLDGRVSVEDGIAYFMERYGIDRADAAVSTLIRSLGYLADVQEDANVPIEKPELADWWKLRQARLVRNL